MLSWHRPAFVVGIICGAILSALYLISLSTPLILFLLIMPIVWLFYFCIGAAGVLSDVRSYRQSIRALVAGSVSGGTAGLMWTMASLTVVFTRMFLAGSAHRGLTSGILLSSAWAVAGAFAEATTAAIFGAAGGMACLILMAEMQKSPS